MDWRAILSSVKQVLDLRLLVIGDTPVTLDEEELIVPIAFPQLDLHVDEPVVEALGGQRVA